MFGLLKVAVFLLALPFGQSKIELDGDVLVLDDSNFEEAKSLHKQMLVEFYAPWCGHCKTLAPEYAKAATAMKAIDPSVKLAKVDATEAKDLASKFGIQGFPTLKFIKSGATMDYDGGRVEKEIVTWLKKKTGPAYATISTVAELKALEEKNEAVVIGVFAKDDDKHAVAFKDYTGTSKIEQTFVVTSSKDILKHLNAKPNTIVVLKDFVFDDKRSDFADYDESKNEDVEKFIASATTPLIQEFSQERSNKIFGSEIKKHVLVFSDKTKAYHDATIAAVKDTATEYKGQALVVTIPTDNKGILDYFGLEEKDCPTVIVVDMGKNMKKFPLPGAITSESVKKHVKAFFADELKPHLKSEEPSPEDVAEPVKVVKGKNFKEMVLDSDVDVLLEIYAPWCGHCKKLEPIYTEMAKELAETNDKLMIVKMDGTANEIDVPGLEASGFPSLFFLPAGKKSTPIPYQGQREKADMIKFISTHATHAVSAGSDEL